MWVQNESADLRWTPDDKELNDAFHFIDKTDKMEIENRK